MEWHLPPGLNITTPSDSLVFATIHNISQDLNFKVKIYAYKIKEKKPVEKFTSLDFYRHKDHIIYIVKNPKSGNPRKRYVGKMVSIDDREYTVKAIELFMINLPYPEGWTMGLLV